MNIDRPAIVILAISSTAFLIAANFMGREKSANALLTGIQMILFAIFLLLWDVLDAL